MLCYYFFLLDKMTSSAPLSKANTSFSLALFKKLSDEDKTGNIFYSPFSISSALAMVMLGTRGSTAAQMSEVTHTYIHSENLQYKSYSSQVNTPISKFYTGLHSWKVIGSDLSLCWNFSTILLRQKKKKKA